MEFYPGALPISLLGFPPRPSARLLATLRAEPSLAIDSLRRFSVAADADITKEPRVYAVLALDGSVGEVLGPSVTARQRWQSTRLAGRPGAHAATRCFRH